MIEKKYQIFVSSTYTDLKDEHLHVLNAITSLKHLAAGMELFCASNDEPLWNKNRKNADRL